MRAFLAVATQLRAQAAGSAGLVALGLDYAGAEAGLRLAGIAATPELWADLQAIEAGAVEGFNAHLTEGRP